MVVEPGPAGDPELVRAAEAIADCMYVPVLSRFRTCDLPMQGQVAAWEERIWEQPSVGKWTALAEQSIAIPKYDVLL